MTDTLSGWIDQVDILIIRAIYQAFGIHIIAEGDDAPADGSSGQVIVDAATDWKNISVFCINIFAENQLVCFAVIIGFCPFGLFDRILIHKREDISNLKRFTIIFYDKNFKNTVFNICIDCIFRGIRTKLDDIQLLFVFFRVVSSEYFLQLSVISDPSKELVGDFHLPSDIVAGIAKPVNTG